MLSYVLGRDTAVGFTLDHFVADLSGPHVHTRILMTELTSKDRLQPALLDRLSDDAPGVRHELSESRIVSIRRLRECVLRDLTNLLNTRRSLSVDVFAGQVFAKESVLNYGLPDLAGRTLSSLDVRTVANTLADTIRRFEPRIIAKSLRVTPLSLHPDESYNSLAFLMEGDLWAQPYPEPLYFKTELDLEGGVVSVDEISPRRSA